MIKTLLEITSWAEIAGIIISLSFVIIYKPKNRETRPLVLYIYIAFVLNLMITAIAKFGNEFTIIPASNHICYNFHSLVRIIFFGWYLSFFKTLRSSIIIRILTCCFCIFFLLNFIFFQPISIFSTRIASVEGICLLLFCSIFFVSTIADNSDTIWMSKPVFFICASINFYAALNFFLLLFFDFFNFTKFNSDTFFASLIIIFSIAYFLLCIVLGIGIKKTVLSSRSLKTDNLSFNG